MTKIFVINVVKDSHSIIQTLYGGGMKQMMFPMNYKKYCHEKIINSKCVVITLFDNNSTRTSNLLDWIGIAHEAALKEHPETENLIKVDEKLYIRIKQINGKYQIRMKAQIAL